MTEDSKWIDPEEAVKRIMEATGKTRQQAKLVLIRFCREGKVRSSAIDTETGERKDVSPEVWPAIN